MANYRRGRINDEMQKTLAVAMRDVKDPRVSNAFVTVTAVEVTPDLKYAKVYYSAMMGDKKEVAKGLRAAAPYLRRRIAQDLNLRITPELNFSEDGSVEYGARIAKLLNGIEFSDDGDGVQNDVTGEENEK